MGACRRPLLGKYTLCYCCFSSAGRWRTHADIKAAGLEIGGQAAEGKRLWSEKINEGNPIAPYLRQTSSQITQTNTQTHRQGLTCRGPVLHVRAHRAPSLGRVQQSDLLHTTTKTLTDNTFCHPAFFKPNAKLL